MSAAPSKRRALAALSLLALVLVALATSRILTPSSYGPLQMRGRSTHVKAQATAAETIRFEVAIPFNPTREDMQLRSVRLVGVHALDVAGVMLSYPTPRSDGTCVSAGNGGPFPPSGRTASIEGGVLPGTAARTCENYPQISIGVRLAPHAASGSIDSVLVVYEAGGSLYQLDLGQSYEVVPPQF